MMKKYRPDIRFEGFTGDWEKSKLGELVKRVTRKNKDLESKLPLTISAQDGLIDQKIFFNKTVASRDISGYYLVKNGEFAYNKSYSNGYPFGAVKRLNRYDMGVLSTLYIVFKTMNIESNFLEKYYDTTCWYKEVSKHAAEGARNHGLLNIAASDFFETELIYPTKTKEQKRISALIQGFDKLIALHQRELENYKLLKKGFSQKLFPLTGETNPSIRFSGFTDVWKKYKLKELGEIQTGNTPSTNDKKNYEESGTMWVTPTDIHSIVTIDTNKKLSQHGLSGARIAKAGSILVTCIASIGKNTLITTDAGFNQQINSVTPFVNYDSYYLLTQSVKWSELMKKIASSGTMQIVNKTEFSNIVTLVPYIDEQIKIGFLFECIDKLITLHQRELDSYKDLKKGFLQKLFV